jgi:hypothetical protein
VHHRVLNPALLSAHFHVLLKCAALQDTAAAATAGVTTPVGAPKPDAWVEVVDKKSGLTYYWNQDSGTANGTCNN